MPSISRKPRKEDAESAKRKKLLHFQYDLTGLSDCVTISIIVPRKKKEDDNLIRFGVSIESPLLERFDKLISKKGYSNRSESIRDMIRDSLVQQEYVSDLPVVGTVTIVYNHEVHDLTHRITHFQHDYADLIVSTLHVHLPEDNCMEVIAMKGPGSRMKQFADALIGMKGVKHGKLTVTSIGST